MDTMMVMFVAFCGVYGMLGVGGVLGIFLGTYVAVWLGWVAFGIVGIGGTAFVTYKMNKLIDGK